MFIHVSSFQSALVDPVILKFIYAPNLICVAFVDQQCIERDTRQVWFDLSHTCEALICACRIKMNFCAAVCRFLKEHSHFSIQILIKSSYLGDL